MYLADIFILCISLIKKYIFYVIREHYTASKIEIPVFDLVSHEQALC